MFSVRGAQRIYVYEEQRIIKSCAVGTTTVEEVMWLSEKMTDYAAAWKECGWGYIVGIGEMTPVSPEISVELVELHKRIEIAGCKAIAFVDPDAYVIAVQAKNHQKRSKASYKEKHFRTEQEAFDWLQKILRK